MSVTSPMRVTTAAGKHSHRSILCHTQLTSCLLLLRRPLTMRAVRTLMCNASRRGSASSDQIERIERLRTRAHVGVGNQAGRGRPEVVEKSFWSNRNIITFVPALNCTFLSPSLRFIKFIKVCKSTSSDICFYLTLYPC